MDIPRPPSRNSLSSIKTSTLGIRHASQHFMETLSSKLSFPNRRSFSTTSMASVESSLSLDCVAAEPVISSRFDVLAAESESGWQKRERSRGTGGMLRRSSATLTRSISPLSTGTSMTMHTQYESRTAGSIYVDSTIQDSNNKPWFKRLKRSSVVPLVESDSCTNSKSFNLWQKRHSMPLAPKGVVYSQQSSVFGVPLTDAIQLAGISGHSIAMLGPRLLSQDVELPYLVDTALAYILVPEALNVEGLFRISGSQQTVKQLVSHFSSGSIRMPIDMIPLKHCSPVTIHDVCALLKRFLQEIPGGLLTQEIFDALDAIFAMSLDSTTQVKSVARVLKEIKETERSNLIRAIFAMLRLVDEHNKQKTDQTTNSVSHAQDSARLQADGLGTIFSPTLLGKGAGCSALTNGVSGQTTLVQLREARAVIERGQYLIKNMICLWPDIEGELVKGELVSHEVDAKEEEDFATKAQQNRSEREPLGTSDSSQINSRSLRNSDRLSTALYTIQDSPVKSRVSKSDPKGHHRRSSTASLLGSLCQCHLNEAKTQSNDREMSEKLSTLRQDLERIDLARLDALHNLEDKTKEACKLFAENLALKREVARLREIYEGCHFQATTAVIS